MRHRNRKQKLGIGNAYRRALLRNLATSLVLFEKVKTTKKKAKAVEPIIEQLINIAKEIDQNKPKMNVIRKLNRIVFDTNASRKLLEDLRTRYTDKNSGYVRIINLGYRKGDAAEMVQIELT